jgi:Alg9-like mannosyltransferase family
MATNEQPASNAITRWLLALMLIGLLVRLVAVPASAGIIVPDEHQQYIEQSFRHLHGYGATFWEQDHGMRHPLFSMLLAGALWVGEAIGLTNPHHLAAFQRLILCLASYGAFCALAWSLHRRGRPIAALVLAALLVGCIDLVFLQVRVISENACIAALALALAVLPRRPLFAGMLLGLMIALRLQAAPIAAGVWVLSAWQAFREKMGTGSGRSLSILVKDSTRPVPVPIFSRAFVRLTIGLAAATLISGAIDFLYYGDWFHSVLANFTMNVVEAGASTWTTSPCYAYLLTGGATMLRVSLFALPLLLWGTVRQPALAAIMALFVLAHSLIPHKEARFLWPLIPLGCLLLAAAFEDLLERGFFRRPAVLACLVLSLLAPSLIRITRIQWNTEHYSVSAHALASIGQQPDVRGVLLIDLPKHLAGNYFYLRHAVPIHYLTTATARELANDHDWNDGELNYVVAPSASLPTDVRRRLEPVAEWGRWRVYRRTNGTDSAVGGSRPPPA